MGSNSGYHLWLGYPELPESLRSICRERLSGIRIYGSSPMINAAAAECRRAFSGLLGLPGSFVQTGDLNNEVEKTEKTVNGKQTITLIAGTYDELCSRGLLSADTGSNPPGTVPGGFSITTRHSGTVFLTAHDDIGILYGIFTLIRLLQQGRLLDDLEIAEQPRMQWRMLNHWDNLDGSIERGYAGQSLWKWDELPGRVDPRYTEYARACASVGINAAVLNNVNTAPQILTEEYLEKVKVLADTFRPFGIRVFLSVNFSSPVSVGGLSTSDPLDPGVLEWWRNKTREIYLKIPDFGGYLVKADSEGQPGPYAYGRTHADGANMLADALADFGGLLIWRAFVYGHGETDRAKTAYTNFTALDGQFRDNAVIQIKNGPIDFQPREPVHPLFGALRNTGVFMEFQVTQEYLGQGNHIVYLGPMWKEILDFDTHARGPGSSVGSILEHPTGKNSITGIAAVANTGDDATWCGSHFHPLNWYALGRLSWDYTLDPGEIAEEWLIQTFGDNRDFIEPVHSMLMQSWEACIDYMTPLGLCHIMREGHHYGPDPGFDQGEREDWRSTYYHRADAQGIGFDRTRTGTAAVDQYSKPIADMFNDPGSCLEGYLLWFHHLPWDHVMASGRSLAEELKYRYRRGVEKAENMIKTWQSVESLVDEERFSAVLEKLKIQAADAREWEEVCTSYFNSFQESITS